MCRGGERVGAASHGGVFVEGGCGWVAGGFFFCRGKDVGEVGRWGFAKRCG